MHIFYGWWVVAVFFTAMFMNIGFSVYSLSLFFKPLIQEFGWSRTALSGLISIMYTVGLLQILIGKLTDFYGTKKVMLAGVLFLGSSFLFLSQIKSLWQIYFLYFLAGIGFFLLNLVPMTKSLSNWFIKKRGLALGIISAATGLGGMVISPLAGYSISLYGWRITYLLFGIVTLFVLVPLVVIIVKNHPEEMGLFPDGLEFEGKNPGVADYEGLRTWEALRDQNFWSLGIANFFYAMGFSSTIIHFVPLVTDQGITFTTAAFALSFVGGISILGKAFYGALSDRFNPRYLLIISFFLLMVGILFLLRSYSTPMLYLSAAIFGLGYGGGTTITPILVGRFFGLKNYGEIYGYIMSIFTLGLIIGPFLAGYLFDRTHSYYLSLNIFAVGILLGILALLCIHSPGSALPTIRGRREKPLLKS